MFKLYKRDASGKIVAYHEAWAEPQRRRLVEHWGMLGEPGETETHRIKLIGRLSKQFDVILDPARALGFTESTPEDESVLIVEYTLEDTDTPDHLAKRHALQDRLNEVLGWTGLGYCDTGTFESGTMQAICTVLDHDLAETVIADALKESEYADYARIYHEH